MKGDLLNNNIVDGFLEDVRAGRVKLGLGINCKLDDNLRYKDGTFNVILGHANTGKTYFILFYMLALAVNHNKRFLIFSSENEVGGLKRNLLELFTQKKLEDLEDKEYFYAKTKIEYSFTFVDTDHLYSYKDLLNCFESNLDKFDACLIDPYNSLVRDANIKGNAHEMDYQIASEFKIFCRKNKKTLYVVAHASTEALRKVHPKDAINKDEISIAGMPLSPSAADIEGGGKWVNRADDFIVIHRFTQHPNLWMNTEIHIKKVKQQSK